MTVITATAFAQRAEPEEWNPVDADPVLAEVALAGLRHLAADDPELAGLLARESRRQAEVLTLVAAAGLADPSVLACQGTLASNVTTEGYPGRRFHAGCEVVDLVENLAVERAKAAFGASYANVQPHSGTSANQAVLFSLLKPGDTLLGLDLSAGGHLTHGSAASVTGQYLRAIPYGLDGAGRIDYDEVRRLAHAERPKVIVCGASSYPRTIDFARFREIADEVGALVLADISHIAGLVAAGLHPSPVPHAHIVTTSTYKQLGGPRGGLILLGRDRDLRPPGSPRTLAEILQRGIFPFFQGTPDLAHVAAKARAFARLATPEFHAWAARVLAGAQALAGRLAADGHELVTGGTDNHMVLLRLRRPGLTGRAVELALEQCGIIVNKNVVPGEPLPPSLASGIRLGTNSAAARGMAAAEMARAAGLVSRVITAIEARGDTAFYLPEAVRAEAQAGAAELCHAFPLPRCGATLSGSEE